MYKLVISLALFLLVSCGKSGSEKATDIISPVAFAQALKEDPGIVVIDVRSSEEMQTGYIAGAYHLDFNSPGFTSSLDSLDRSKRYLLYCASGKRSGKALEMMKEKGFTLVAAMDGGLRAWNMKGFPMEIPSTE